MRGERKHWFWSILLELGVPFDATKGSYCMMETSDEIVAFVYVLNRRFLYSLICGQGRVGLTYSEEVK